MSLRDDARDCLIRAIHDRKNLDVTPEQLNKFKPSDPQIGTQDGFAWLEILKAAVACMRAKHRVMGDPDQAHAADLLDELLIESQLYLEGLATRRKGRFRLRPFLLVGAFAAALGTVALAVRDLGSRRK